MRKTTNMKKLSAAVLAMAMTTSMAMTALAVPNPQPGMGNDTDFNQNSATTSVNVVGMTNTEIPGNLSASVPITVRLAVLENGDVRGPRNYAITNKTNSRGIKVTKLVATPQGNYIITGQPTADQVGLNTISLTPGSATADQVELQQMAGNGYTVPTTNNSWTMGPATGNNNSTPPTSLTLTFGGGIDGTLKGDATTQQEGERAFTVVFTIEQVTANP